MRTLPQSIGLLLAALLLLAVYYPSLSAEGLWDDNYFIFWRYTFNPLPTLGYIWKAHFWPMYDTVAIGLYRWWGQQYVLWRSLNLVLHFTNSLAVAWLVSRWRPQYYWPVLLAFLIHPLNVMSVAFIIQVKTLLSMFFLLGAAGLLWFAEQKKRTILVLPAAVCFFLSVTSKSASLPFPFIALLGLALFQQLGRKRLLMLLPFILISGLSLLRIGADDLLQARTASHEERALGPSEPEIVAAPAPTVAIEVTPTPTPAPEPAPVVVEEVKPVETPSVRTAPAPTPAPEPTPAATVIPEPVVEIQPAPALPTPPPNALPPLSLSKWQMILHNFGEYTFYPLWPWPLSLAHGRFTGSWSWRAWAGLIVFVSLMGVSWWRKQRTVLFLVLAYSLALLPFLGFIFAPYMSYTAISEQHLYLVLPFALLLMLMGIDRLKDEDTRRTVVALGLTILCGLSIHYVASYTSEEAVFRRILRERPQDLFAHVNLAGYFRRIGHMGRAEIVMRQAARLVEENPELRREPAYQQFLTAWEQYGL